MIELPVVSEAPEHVFDQEELARCADGECCQCGRCCTIPEVYPPRELGKASRHLYRTGDFWLIQKLPGEVCPQMIWKDGRAACACHASKNSEPSLAPCAQFSGMHGGYAKIVEHTRDMAETFVTRDEAELMREWWKRGLLSDIGWDDGDIRQFQARLRRILGELDFPDPCMPVHLSADA